MKQYAWQTTLALAAFFALLSASGAADEFLLHGRVSFDTGATMVKGASEDEWSAAVVNTLVMPGDTLWVDESGVSEIEMAGASFLRLADSSRAEVVSLPPQAHVRGWKGSFYVHRLTRSQGDFIFTTPSATVEIPADAMVRLDIDGAGAVTVSVRWGSARIRTDEGGEVTAADSMRVWIDPGFLPSEAALFDRAQTDAFDDWNNERARTLAEGASTTPKNVVIQGTTVGRHDLARYGEWVTVDSRPYWRPTVVRNYVPYRHGYWNYVPAVGHVWVDEYPFAYVTSHYGRWRHTASYGWLWSYDPVWSPAWVASVRVGDYYAWAPVDYYHRPVLVSSGVTFSVGGIAFSHYSTSYVRASYLYAGPRYVHRPTTVIINNFTTTPLRQVHIWNISPDRRRRPSVPYDSRIIAGGRDYSPRRSIRGGRGDWVKDFAPSDRARRLEANLGRTQFAASSRAENRSLRTASADNARTARTRQVRLSQTEQAYLATSRGERGDATSARSLFVPESTRLGRDATGRDAVSRPSVPRQEAGRGRTGDVTVRGTESESIASRPTSRDGIRETVRDTTTPRSAAQPTAPTSDRRGATTTPERTLRPERTGTESVRETTVPRTTARPTAPTSERTMRPGRTGTESVRDTTTPRSTVRPTAPTTERRSATAPERTPRPESTGVRQGTTTSVRRDGDTPSLRTREGSDSGRVALRDMESSAPAPQRTPIRQDGTTSTPRGFTAPPASAPRSSFTTPNRTPMRQERTTPAPSTRSVTPPASRQEPPTVRRTSPPTPTPRTEVSPPSRPTVRQQSGTSQRSATPPAARPGTSVRRESAPAPSTRSITPPTTRSAPAPSTRSAAPPVTRSAPAPSTRSAAPPVTRSAPAPSTRSAAPPVTRSAPAPSTRSAAPQMSRPTSTPSVRGGGGSGQRPQPSSGSRGSSVRGRR